MFWTNDLRSTRRSQSTDKRSSYLSQSVTQIQPNIPLPEIKSAEPQNDMSQKVQRFISINKRHHSDQVCVCQDCIYAKQLNRYEHLKMDLSKNTSYRAQYSKHLLKKNYSNTIDLNDSVLSSRPKEGITKTPYVNCDSVYSNSFASRSFQKIQKPKPTDQLKFTGPTSSLSSYHSLHPKLNGPYQFVQPAKQEPLPSYKFNSGSIYNDSYKSGKMVQTQSAKMNDQLKLGKASLVKESTNKTQFNIPNPELFKSKDRYLTSQQTRIQTPNFSFQYKTINRDQFQKPTQKKNCRNRRMQILHGQILTSQQDLSTVS